MKYIDFINTYKEPMFSLQDLKIAKINILPVQLSQWVRNNYILKIKNGFYIFNERKDRLNMEIIANFIYQPSYISLERALSRYGLMPEIVYNVTSITTKKTMINKNIFGVFIFRNIKKELFFGYNKVEENGNIYFLADPEKALLDYLYLNSSKINNLDDIKELRLNEITLKDLDRDKIKEYIDIFNSIKLKRIFELIIK